MRRLFFFAFFSIGLSTLMWPRFKPFYHFYNYFYGTKALSLANAFTAVADDLTAIYWNPAGLAQIEQPEFYLSYRTVDQNHEYDIQKREHPTCNEIYNYHFNSSLNQIDAFSVSVPARFWGLRWGFALGYYRHIPYSLKGLQQSQVLCESDNTVLEESTVSFHGSEGVDILGFSTSVYYKQFFSLGITLQQFFNTGEVGYFYKTGLDAYEDQFSERIQGRNLIVGVLIHPIKSLAIGFTYHTRLQNKLESNHIYYRYDDQGQEVVKKLDSSIADISIPSRFSLGLLLKPSQGVRLSFDYSKIYWSSGKLANYFDYSIELTYPTREDFHFRQLDVENRRLGIEIAVPISRWVIYPRGGIFSDDQIYRDNQDLGVKLRGYALGIGLPLSSSLLAEIAYMRQWASWTEPGYFALTENDAVNTHFHANIFNLAITYRFKKFLKAE